jgi:hypothetical protein
VKLIQRNQIVDIADKGKAILLDVCHETFEAQKDGSEVLVQRNTQSWFLRGKDLGGFGFKGKSPKTKL